MGGDRSKAWRRLLKPAVITPITPPRTLEAPRSPIYVDGSLLSPQYSMGGDRGDHQGVSAGSKKGKSDHPLPLIGGDRGVITSPSFLVPIRTKNPLNGNQGSWRAVHGKRLKEREAVGLLWPRRALLPPFPLVVHLERHAPSSGLDDDGLQASLKSVRDQVAEELGVDDRDPRVRWTYGQRRSPWGVLITIRSAT